MTLTRPGRDAEPELRLTDAGEIAALKSAAFRSARACGIGPDKAAEVAEHLAAHMAGHLAQHGFTLRLDWISTAAREVMSAPGRPPD